MMDDRGQWSQEALHGGIGMIPSLLRKEHICEDGRSLLFEVPDLVEEYRLMCRGGSDSPNNRPVSSLCRWCLVAGALETALGGPGFDM